MNEKILRDIEIELQSTRKKIPGNAHMMNALTEEVGEISKALLDLEFEEKGSNLDVYNECIQAIAVIFRIIEEGDSTFPTYKPLKRLLNLI